MRHDIDHAGLLQRGQADRGAAIVGEHQEGAAIGDHPAMQRHAVHRRGHAEFADAVIDIASAAVVGGERTDTACLGVVGLGQVGAAADRIGQVGVDFAQRHLARLARRDLLRFVDQRLDISVQAEALGQIARHPAFEFGLVPMRLEPVAPFGARRRTTLGRPAPVGQHLFGNFQRRRLPAQRLADCSDFIVAQRCAVGGTGALLVG